MFILQHLTVFANLWACGGHDLSSSITLAKLNLKDDYQQQDTSGDNDFNQPIITTNYS